MASFAQRQPLSFGSYIPQYDLGLYATVGTQRQQMYDANLAKVKNYQQSVYGIQTVRDIDSQYVQQAGDELSSQLQQLAGADFSKEQVLSQAGGMASKIYNDKNIQNIAISTQNYFDANKQIEQAHKDGKSGISNDHAILRNIQAWQQGDLSSSLGKQTYTNFFDYQKGFQDFMKDKHGNVIVEQNPFSTNSDGSPNWSAYALVEGKKVYLDPMNVSQDAQTYFASNIQASNQLFIDSQYYSDMTPNDVALREFQMDNQKELSKYDSLISDLEAQKKIGNGNSRDIDLKISQYQDAKAKASLLYRQRESDFMENPTQAKMALHQKQIINGFANRFAYQDLEQKIVKNPYFEGQLEEQKLNLSLEKFKFERDTWKQEFGLKVAKQNLDEKEFQQKYGISSDGTLLSEGGYIEYNPSPQEVLNSVNEMGAQVKQNQLKVMYDMGLTQNVTLGRDSGGNPLYIYKGSDSDFQKAWSTLETTYQSNPQGANPFLKKYYQDETSTTSGVGKERAYLAQRDQLTKVETQLDELFNNDPNYRNYRTKINSLGNANEVLLNENGTTITRGDLIKFANASKEMGGYSGRKNKEMSQLSGLNQQQIDLITERSGEYTKFQWSDLIPAISLLQPNNTNNKFEQEFSKVSDIVNDRTNEAYSQARNQAYREIVYNQPRIALTLSPDGSNAKVMEDKSGQLRTIAYSQKNEDFDKVIGDKKGKVTIGARVDPLSHRIYAFAHNTNGGHAEMELSPPNARALFPSLTLPNKYSSVLDRLNANRPQKGVAATTGSGSQGAYSPQMSNLNNYVLRAQYADDGQENYLPIIEYKTKNSNVWSQIPQPSFFGSIEEADQYFQKVASLDDAVFENTFLK